MLNQKSSSICSKIKSHTTPEIPKVKRVFLVSRAALYGWRTWKGSFHETLAQSVAVIHMLYPSSFLYTSNNGFVGSPGGFHHHPHWEGCLQLADLGPNEHSIVSKGTNERCFRAHSCHATVLNLFQLIQRLSKKYLEGLRFNSDIIRRDSHDTCNVSLLKCVACHFTCFISLKKLLIE